MSSAAVNPSQESIPVWQGWQPQQQPAVQQQQQPAVPQQQPAFLQPQPAVQQPAFPQSAAAQVPPYASPVASAPSFVAPEPTYPAPNMSAELPSGGYAAPVGPPQSWESYDYTAPESSASAADAGTVHYSQARDASRPLPPLSDLFNEEEDAEELRERAKETVVNFSLWAAGIVLVPIPFSDLILLMPIQSAMVIAVGRIFGVKDTPERILAIIAGACGASVFGQITTLLVANLIPVIGKVISAPFVFGWTYGLGEVAIRYFESQGQASSDELKQIYKKASKEASRGYDSKKTRVAPGEALNNLRDYMSEEEYQKIRERFGPGTNA